MTDKDITYRLKIFAAVLALAVLVGCGTSPVADEEAAADEEASMSDSFESERAEAEAERQAAEEEAARREAEAEREAAERAAAEEAARREAEAEREAAEEAAARRAAEEEAARQAAEEEAARREAEAEREAAGQAAAEEAARQEAEAQAAAEEAERQAAEEEAARQEAEREAAEQAAAEEAERRAAEEQAAAEQAEAEQASDSADESAAFVNLEDAPDIIPRTPENIERLGQDLTPMGSIRAGNEDGTIPAWDGGLTREDWPAGYQPGDRHPDPYPDDEPLFTITGDNYQEYADRLSAGQIAVFERYPETYYMKVYPTRRSASFPERIYQKTRENAETGRLVANGEGVADVAEGFPFALPQNAYELIWNHKLKYKGIGGARYNNQVVPTSSGNFQLIRLREELLGLYYKEGMTLEETNNILLYFFQEVESPARLAGNILLVHETLNQIEQPRQAWIYNPGQRRVRRAPNVAYDNPGTASDGLRTNDMTDMFNGAMDRYDWEIVGKKEMYIPYNSYDVHSGDLTADDIVRPGHLNPEYMRYELHRVWIVEANLKEGTRHIHPRRTFYLDEDSYQIALTDHYDQRGNLWRVSEAHTINYYELPTYWSSMLSHMDLQSGRYVATGLDNQDPVPSFNVELSPSNYTPQALRTRGRR
ncbi:DUF1329 domain-containing protein [Wenzhouxiangella sp. XN201]|uniref:DUF1329 domain-containing protein n=1 Tax=Wenzhouxiangella sp. XN201 TaxID=2710755 RepID=UPI001969FDB6|nr:DUF1329 domain-containing protein [Wenzhouxiangella sp. XN201]